MNPFFTFIVMLQAGLVFAGDKSPISDTSDRHLVVCSAEQMPQYPGGDDSLMAFIRRNFEYPRICERSYTPSRLVVAFTVDTNGHVSDVKIKRPSSPEFDREAVRVIKMLPDFIPGRDQGKKVSVNYLIPLYFRPW